MRDEGVDLWMGSPVDAAGAHIVDVEVLALLGKFEQRCLRLPLDAAEDGCKSAGRLRGAFARHVDKGEGRIGMQGTEGIAGGEGQVAGDVDVRAVVVSRGDMITVGALGMDMSWIVERRWTVGGVYIADLLLIDVVLRHAQGPHAALRVIELGQ
jgi:hypothetical protein